MPKTGIPSEQLRRKFTHVTNTQDSITGSDASNLIYFHLDLFKYSNRNLMSITQSKMNVITVRSDRTPKIFQICIIIYSSCFQLVTEDRY